MSLDLANITLDCDDPQAVAAFWSAALERPIDDGASPYFASIGTADRAERPAWLFIKVPEPKAVKNRVHLDLDADDRAAEVERLVSLGATHVTDRDEWGHSWAVLTDVEGNEFCVAQGNSAQG